METQTNQTNNEAQTATQGASSEVKKPSMWQRHKEKFKYAGKAIGYTAVTAGVVGGGYYLYRRLTSVGTSTTE